MTLTVAELRLLLEALDMAIGRRQAQANYYEARPERFSRVSVERNQNKIAALHTLSCHFAALRPRQDVLEVT